MSVSFYADVHVAIAIVRALHARGIDVLRAQDDGMGEAADPDLLDRAAALGRTTVTHDKDFLIEAERRQRLGIPFAGVVFGHQPKATVATMVRDLELIASALNPEDLRDRVEHLPY